MPSTTSSFRIPEALQVRLEECARVLKKRKNWIINQALEEYLDKHQRKGFAAEAKRQSLLASGVETADESSGWRGLTLTAGSDARRSMESR